MALRIGVVTFPGSLDDVDALRGGPVERREPVSLWHGNDSLDGVDAVILPGGFSYGDYLRCGAIARFAPVMAEVIKAGRCRPTRAGDLQRLPDPLRGPSLPGALIRNDVRTFVCKDQDLRVESVDTPWTCALRAGPDDQHRAEERRGRLRRRRRDPAPAGGRGAGGLPLRHGNPNGSFRDIAGICNDRGNVVGLMPHPEHNVDPLTGPTTDGTRSSAACSASSAKV